MLMLGSRGTALFLAFMLASVAIGGVVTGAEADSRAEIKDEFDEPPEIDYEEQERPYAEIVPEEYTEPLDLGLAPESTLLEQQYKAFADRLVSTAWTVAEQSALFGYAHRGIFGSSAVQQLLHGSMYLTVFGILALQFQRLRKLRRGVDG